MKTTEIFITKPFLTIFILSLFTWACGFQYWYFALISAFLFLKVKIYKEPID